ncbi:hypothetical protein A0H81_09961 [Grifola frondosa]|uniref:Uncharacterized protein n=1 Tax=Grifola frondosa TaxID=5627 RepID=A0A1C7M1X1_GRIFR|nr:hypothetical protein A0H81_09961 [Grifola frondosa]
MRIIDTLSHAPRDSSPPIGFWDKLRLVFHWRVKVFFKHEVHLHMKGSRDPHETEGAGAGFALCWTGHPQLLIGQPNDAGELVQVVSDSMLVVIPNVEDSYSVQEGVQEKSKSPREGKPAPKKLARKCPKVCAKFRSGVCLVLENKVGIPELKSTEDSYNGFRSDFIHIPAVFTSRLRQGNLYSRKRPVSPKFGQHLATLKYRVSVPQLFISHAYIDNSKDAWTDGVTPFIGVKALINQFQADMHQRDQETSRMTLGGVKTIHHKPFYAVEVVMKGLDLRAMLAVFLEPLKESVAAESPSFVGEYRTRHDLHPVDLGSPWIDLDDFVDNDWLPSTEPTVHLLPAASCPRFTYFKRTVDRDPSAPESQTECSKFGAEDTHVCFLGKEPSVSQIQIDLASARVKELQQKTLDAARAARPQGMRMSSIRDQRMSGQAMVQMIFQE